MAIITEIRRKLPLPLPTDPASDEARQDVIHSLPVEDIIPNRAQPRSSFNQNAIVRLCDSIRRYGILQPLTVRKLTLSDKESGGRAIYELVAGERRLRAAKMAELTHVPCIIINTDDATSAELAIIENLLRENLNMFEQAEAFERLINEFHLTQDEAARRVSLSQSAVANKLRLLRLLPEERRIILEAHLTERHARALLKLSDQALRGEVLSHIVQCKLNVSASEAYIDRILDEQARFWAKNAEKSSHSGKNGQNESFSSADEADDEVSEVTVCEQPSDTDSTLPSALQNVIARRRGSFKGCFKDLEPFYRSLHNAVGILEQSGIVGEVRREESDGRVVVTIVLSRP